MSISSKKLNWKRAAGLTGTALVLGGTFATAPTIAATPESSFGLVESASAATLTGVEASIPGNNRIGTVSTDHVVASLTYGASQNTGVAGDTFVIAVKDQNFLFSTNDNPVGKKFVNAEGVEFAEVTASNGNGFTVTLLEGANNVTAETFVHQLNMRANGAKWNTTAGETKDLIFTVNGAEVVAGPVVVAPNSGTPNITVKGGTASWRTMQGASSSGYAFDGRAAFEYKSTTPAELGKHAWGAISIPENQKELITFNEDILMQANEGNPYYSNYWLTPTKYVEGTGWVADTSKPAITGSTKTGDNPLNFKWTGLDDQGRMTFEYDIPADQTYAINISTVVSQVVDGKPTSYHGGYDLTKKAIVEKTTVAFGGRVDTVIADSASAPVDQRTYWSPLGLHPQAFTWQDGLDFAVLYPKAINDTFTGDSGSTITVDLMSNDTSMKEYGVTLNPESIELIVNGQKVGKTYTFEGAGTVTVDDKGIVTIKVVEGFEGEFPSFDYYIEDTNKGDSQATVTGTINALPTLTAEIKTYIDGQDANDKDNPVVLAPGDYDVTYVIPNNNAFAITSDQLNLPGVNLGDFTIEPGQSHTVTGKVTLASQGSISLEPTLTVTRTLANGKVMTATASDPAYVIAQTSDVSANPDILRLRLGDTASMVLTTNDIAGENSELDTTKVRVTAGEGWTAGEDGTYTFTETGLKVSIVDGELKVLETGSEEGVFEGLTYTIENNLGDISAATPITIVVFDYHADFQSYVGEGEDLIDADTTDEAYTPEVITDKDVTEKELDVRLDAANTGKDAWNVEKMTYVIKDADGNVVQIDQNGELADEGIVELGETTVVEPGQMLSISGKQVFGIGKYSIEYTLHTDKGQVLTDPIFVEVVQEIVPDDAPSVELPEAEIPVVEEEKPADPVVVTKTEEKPAPVDPNTGEGASAKMVANTADTDTEDESNSMGLIIGGLGIGGLLAIGGIIFAWRKGLIRKLADAPLNRK